MPLRLITGRDIVAVARPVEFPKTPWTEAACGTSLIVSRELHDNYNGGWAEYYFEEPRDLVEVQIAFYEGKENNRMLKVYSNGN